MATYAQLRMRGEKEIKGESLQEYGKRMFKRKRKLSPDKFDRPSIGDRVILAMLRAKKKIKGRRKPLSTQKTKQITTRLRNAGLDDASIKKLKGKKK